MKKPYEIMICCLAICALCFFFSLLPKKTPPVRTSPFARAQGYYLAHEKMGIVRVIPLAGPVLESPTAQAMPPDITPVRE